MPCLRVLGFLAVLLAVPTTAAVVTGAPFANAGLDQTVEVNRTVYLDGSGSYDPDGRIVEYAWDIDTPDGSERTPDCAGCARTQFEPTQTGRYNVTLQVEDDDGNVRSDYLYVTVEARHGPSINLTGPDTAESGDDLTYTATATAGDADLSGLVWETNGSFARTTTADGERANDSFTFEYTSDINSVSVRVTDIDGQQASETIDIRDSHDSYGRTANWDYRKYGLNMYETNASDFGDKSYDLEDKTVYTDFNGDGKTMVDGNAVKKSRVDVYDENSNENHFPDENDPSVNGQNVNNSNPDM